MFGRAASRIASASSLRGAALASAVRPTVRASAAPKMRAPGSVAEFGLPSTKATSASAFGCKSSPFSSFAASAFKPSTLTQQVEKCAARLSASQGNS